MQKNAAVEESNACEFALNWVVLGGSCSELALLAVQSRRKIAYLAMGKERTVGNGGDKMRRQNARLGGLDVPF